MKSQNNVDKVDAVVDVLCCVARGSRGKQELKLTSVERRRGMETRKFDV